MKIFLPFIILLFLTACTTSDTPTIIRERPVAVSVPTELYDCPTLNRLPRVSTLTEIEVARTIITLHSNNQRCAASIRSIREYVQNAERRINSSN